MGYTSTAEGKITITPPLNHQELKGLPALTLPYGREVELVIEATETETPGGTLISRQASAIRPRDESEEWKRYNTASQLRTLVEAFPDHEFTGWFEFLGEDGERWRMVATGREVIDDVKPELRWPEL